MAPDQIWIVTLAGLVKSGAQMDPKPTSTTACSPGARVTDPAAMSAG